MVIKTYVTWNKQSKTGGYSAIVDKKIVSGSKTKTTWQRCELEAIIAAIKKLPTYDTVTHVQIAEPSSYVAHAMEEFRTYIRRAAELKSAKPLAANNRPIRNLDLWEQLIAVAREHNVHLDH